VCAGCETVVSSVWPRLSKDLKVKVCRSVEVGSKMKATGTSWFIYCWVRDHTSTEIVSLEIALSRKGDTRSLR
jgi:hypothetical protein